MKKLLMYKLSLILLTAFVTSLLTAMECTDVAMPDAEQEERFPLMELPPELQLHVIEHATTHSMSSRKCLTIKELAKKEQICCSHDDNLVKQLFDAAGFAKLDSSIKRISVACLEHVRTLAVLRRVSRYFAFLLEPKFMATSLRAGDYDDLSFVLCLDNILSDRRAPKIEPIIWVQTILLVQKDKEECYKEKLYNLMYDDRKEVMQAFLVIMSPHNTTDRDSVKSTLTGAKRLIKNEIAAILEQWLNQGNTQHESSDA